MLKICGHNYNEAAIELAAVVRTIFEHTFDPGSKAIENDDCSVTQRGCLDGPYLLCMLS